MYRRSTCIGVLALDPCSSPIGSSRSSSRQVIKVTRYAVADEVSAKTKHRKHAEQRSGAAMREAPRASSQRAARCAERVPAEERSDETEERSDNASSVKGERAARIASPPRSDDASRASD